MSRYNGEVHFRGMTESDWRRLHTRVIPNPVPLEEFKVIVLTGKLQDRYLAKDLHKMMQELRDLLREHGELREAAIFPLSGKKQELAQAAAAAVRVIDAHRECIPALRRSPGSTATPLPLSADTSDARDGSTSPTLDSASDQQRRSTSGRGSAEQQTATGLLLASSASGRPPTSPRRSFRILSLSDHVSTAKQPLASSAALLNGASPTGAAAAQISSSATSPPARRREPAVARGGSADRSAGQDEKPAKEAPSRLTTSWTTNERLSSTIAQHAAAAAPAAASLPHQQATDPATPFSTVGPTLPLSTAATNELALLNEAAPPFFCVLNVARRFQLRFGSSPLKFEIPVQYTEAVHNRRLRVYVIPLHHPNIPARWPTAKEFVVYVNEQCVMTPWKRSWPERKQEVAKTFLPLDITYLLSRNITSQRMQTDVFNKEYLSPAIVAVVQPRSLEEVTESMLLSRLGCRNVAQVKQAFEDSASRNGRRQTPTCPPSLLVSNNAAVLQSYARILDDDEEEDGLEVDDPVITTKCPISQLPLSIPVRGPHCRHLQCVDLDSFLVSSHKGAYWNCALCDAEMRPKGVQIDTVLWSYLSSFGSSDSYPAYLRLSARVSPGTATESKYYWHPSNRTGEDADVVTTDNDNDDAEQREAEEQRNSSGGDGNGDGRVAHEDGRPRPRTAPTPPHVLHPRSMSSPQDSPATGTPISSNSSASWTGEGAGTTGNGRKRSRETSTGEQQGTADDPIEL
ncbi:hypothetical protein ABB37_00632 [Leptomonas pyrrhocoris]|uniref:SP-RING-type domain-containing protein n=1 Tax=Leptomonas pyrrhocoris TaxID=157538 RepID=A0A0N0VHT9_LEPPY|nr:hypothetical protein ABB37_00632 [Leptomonas pyrrhocoris]KPA86481.1 hypothetical protein ABB37_00632 [Leptomonas pyrrhocoris]|eukprot:XP_015664920.1 hypothetical protein ABB37_00632 [Leptomonas pyrrhocoris]